MLQRYLPYTLCLLLVFLALWHIGMPAEVWADKLLEAKIANPTPFTSVEEVIEAILGVVIVIATPIIVFFIIYAGFLYVTARGNVQQVEQATRQLTYAVIGAVLILGAVALAEIIKNLIATF
jgi:formate-dependent nitrite reductase membrane component NrfD